MKNLKNVISVITLALVMLVSVNVSAQENFEKAGTDHNEYLKEILLNLNSTANKGNVFDLSVGILSSKVSRSEVQNIYEFSDYSNPTNMLNELFNKKMISKALYEKCKSTMNEVLKYNSYTEIATFVDSRKDLRSDRTLPYEDQIKFNEFLSIMKHTSEFWDPKGENGVKYLYIPNPKEPGNSTYPTSKGGPNPNYSVLSKRGSLEELTEMMTIDWIKVGMCDCIGGIFSGGNPAGAAIASGCSIVMQL